MRFNLFLTVRYCEKCKDWNWHWFSMVWKGEKTYHAYYCTECEQEEVLKCRSTT